MLVKGNYNHRGTTTALQQRRMTSPILLPTMTPPSSDKSSQSTCCQLSSSSARELATNAKTTMLAGSCQLTPHHDRTRLPVISHVKTLHRSSGEPSVCVSRHEGPLPGRSSHLRPCRLCPFLNLATHPVYPRHVSFVLVLGGELHPLLP